MDKKRFGPTTLAYPMPAFLIGANVAGKPNFLAAAWGGIACGEPPMVSIAIHHQRFTLKGIQDTGTFSVCVPSVDQVAEVDFCGIVSGKNYDKVAACGFEVFYGELGNAPMVKQCPVSFECKLEQMPDLGSHFLLIGRIVETYVSEDCLTDGKPDVEKIRPFLYSSGYKKEYHSFGEAIAPAFKRGKEIKRRLNSQSI